MEQHSKDLVEIVEAIATEVEQFLTVVTREIDQMVDVFIEASEAIAQEVEHAFEAGVERKLTELIDPILEAYLGFEVEIDRDMQYEDDYEDPELGFLEPELKNHPACVGCRHYHGQAYGGTVFVCAMHPYGSETETCPDWQSFAVD